MEWELWIESSDNFAGLKKNLYRRGFKKLPIAEKCKFIECNGNLDENQLTLLPNQTSMMRKKRHL